MNLYPHIQFLKAVLLFALTAFGGPQGHLLYMFRIFVDQRQDISEKELLELNTFCSLLPGASSTQLLILIAHKKGGVYLAFLSLVVWVLPASLLMGALAILLTLPNSSAVTLNYFQFLQPMVVGFIIFSAFRSFQHISKGRVQVLLSLTLAAICLLFYRTPLIFPIVIVLGGIIGRYTISFTGSKKLVRKPHIRWLNLIIFIGVFLISGILSQLSKKQNWNERAYFNLFENCYRFGSIVFGGGDVMIPIMYEQYVARPTSQRVKTRNQNVLKIDKELFLSGAGVVRSIPGPVFSFSAFVGGSAMSGRGLYHQMGGICIASIAIFFPSFLLALFFHPLWEYMHRFQNLIPIFEGIQASTVAIMLASGLYLSKDAILILANQALYIHATQALVVFMTLLLLWYRVLSPFQITVTFLMLGFLS